MDARDLMLGTVCAAFVACGTPPTVAPHPEPREATPQEPRAQPSCLGFVAFDDLEPAHELRAPIACGNRLNELFQIEIGPDGHVISVDAATLQYPNSRAIQEIKGWVFKPTLHDGIPVAVCTSLSRHPPTFTNKAEICPAS